MKKGDQKVINEENKNQEINEEVLTQEQADNVEEQAPEAGEPEGAEREQEEAAEGKEEKKGFFGKKKEKKDPKDEKIEELTDRLKRSMAEFDNFRKRTEKEKSAMFEMGAKDVVEKILPVVDNFERGLAAIPDGEKEGSFAKGMEMIYKQLMKTLEDMGVKPIEAVGMEFDPNFHNAVMHIDDENFGENVVAAELQKGYMYRDSVVRHSMVQVAN
ncbi:nucleotide exchange factor GrpE [Clostridium sp. AM58-1XD]|nr:nucleotide exchange factor GrpE [Clostridium sp. AM58-1XD]